jgi:prepilin-type N-terminal cleavage/methylation domain-containing protein
VRTAPGFSLAEVLVATAVLTIGLMAVAIGFQQAGSGVAVGGGETAAVFLAEQRIEQLRAVAMSDFAGASLAAGTTTEHCVAGHVSGNAPTCQGAPNGGPSYTRSTTVTDVTAGVGCPAVPLSCKQVDVSVTYRPVTSTGQLDQVRSVRLVTVLGPRV